MKKFLLSIAMLLTLGLSIQGVAAQVDAPEVTGTSFEDVEGLESGYGRAYMSSNPEDLSGNIGVQGLKFDSDDNAEKFLEDGKNSLDEAMDSEALEGMEVTSSDLEDFDKDGYIVEMSMSGEISMQSVVIAFVDGDTVFQVTVMGDDMEASKTQAYDVANYIADAEVENEEVTLNADGTSTGGVFDRMPAAGEEFLGEMAPMTDMDLSDPTGGQ